MPRLHGHTCIERARRTTSPALCGALSGVAKRRGTRPDGSAGGHRPARRRLLAFDPASIGMSQPGVADAIIRPRDAQRAMRTASTGRTAR